MRCQTGPVMTYFVRVSCVLPQPEPAPRGGGAIFGPGEPAKSGLSGSVKLVAECAQ